MKRKISIIALCMVFLCATCIAFAAPSDDASSGTQNGRIGVILYMLDADGSPLANTTILMQEDLDSEDAYEGVTDRQGIMMIPGFPFTGFVMASRDSDNALSGLIDVTLYPGSETRIMNNPRSDHDTITLDELRDTTLSAHINGTAPLEIAGDADSITMYHYEVQVSQEAGGLGALFELAAGNVLELQGVSDGQPGGVIPEPTLPPDAETPSDTQAPTATQSPSASPGQSPSASASNAPSEQPSESASASEEPTQTSGSLEPTETATQTDGTVAPTQAPSEQSTATPTPIPPSPTPSAAPTTDSNLINMKLFLKNAQGEALPYYKTVLNGSVEATTNGEGEAYYTNVATNVAHQLAVFNPEGTEVGSCSIQFVPGTSTSLASVNTGGSYTIDYQQGTQDVYVELVVNNGSMDVGTASQAPLTPGTTSSSGASSSGGSSTSTSAPTDDVIGTPNTTVTTSAGPSLRGYFSNVAGTAIPGATIRLRNEDTKALSSAITTADGTFTISQIPPGNYSIGALSPEGNNLGQIDFTAARGSKTQLKESSNGTLYLSEASDADTVYMDLRELSNGTLGLMYAAQSPMLAPAVPSTAEEQLNPPVNPPVIEEQVEATIIDEPDLDASNTAATVAWVVGIGAAAAVVAILLVRRRVHIK